MYSCLIDGITYFYPPSHPSLLSSSPTHQFLPPFHFCLSLPQFISASLPPSLPPLAPPGSVQNINTMRVTADVTRLIVSWEVPAVTNGQLISHQVVVTHWINGRMTTVYNETVSRSTFTVNITGLRKYHQSILYCSCNFVS